MQRLPDQDGIEVAVGQRDAFRGPGPGLDAGGALAQHREHRRVRLHCDDVKPAGGQDARQLPGPRAQVEHAGPFRGPGQRRVDGGVGVGGAVVVVGARDGTERAAAVHLVVGHLRTVGRWPTTARGLAAEVGGDDGRSRVPPIA
ncbi:hypothetical protein BG618_03487 [Pseudonocardia autotrophica]|nr:hypothetical protein BG618_03487 [Pseudonocardia autotrophica]